MLSDTVPPTLPPHPAFLPELPPVPTHAHSICYPASHLLYPGGLSHSYCQHSYQCLFLQSCLTSLAISFKPWCSQLCGTAMAFRQQFPSFLTQRSDFLLTQPGNTWLILLLSSNGPQCTILWVSEGPLQVMQGSFPWAKIPVSGSRKASHGACRSSEDPGERHLHSSELHQHQSGSSAGLCATKTVCHHGCQVDPKPCSRSR